MDAQISHVEMIKQAQLGNSECMDQLARQANSRLQAYIFRLTLDRDLTQDLLQETLLQMVKSLQSLRQVDRFWPWLYRIALSKAQIHFRNRRQEVVVHTSTIDIAQLSRHASGSYNDGLSSMIRKELAEAIFQAMGKLKLEHRDIIILRCFEHLSYKEIADAAGCSEVRVRTLFFRAKHSLKQQLSRRGFSKWMFIIALGLFARKTASAGVSYALTNVTAASTKVGLTGTILGAAGTKIGIAAAAAVTATALTVGGIAKLADNDVITRSEVKSFYYTEQFRNAYPDTAFSSLSYGAYERWYYFPEGIDGPMFWRHQRWTPDQKNKLCSWLTNDQGTYYYHSGEKTVYVFNRYPFSKLSTRRLPSDPVDFTEFLNKVEGEIAGVKYTRDRKTGLLISAVDNRFVDARNFHTSYQYNTLEESFFKYNWPSDIPVIDERDEMHKRGWTYFRITGEIGDVQILGRGRIPFVYADGREHYPWLNINIVDRLVIVDTPSGSYLTRPDGKIIETYPPGGFLKGLNRPWMGLSALNLVRRDAAGRRLWFETKIRGEYPQEQAQVTLVNDPQDLKTELIYLIDPQKDVIESIKITTFDNDQIKSKGILRFEYLEDLEDIEQVANEFVAPAEINIAGTIKTKSTDSFWLMDLAQGTLGLSSDNETN